MFSKYSPLHITVIRIFSVLLLMPVGMSCKKYLDKKSNYQLAIPSNLNDVQMILDKQTSNYSPGLLELPADDYYATDNSLNAVSPELRLNYFWDKDAKFIYDYYGWVNPYEGIYEANFVLDLLPSLNKSEASGITYNSVKGTSLFYRGFLFYQLAQLFCKPYSNTASTDPGIVLKLNSLVTEKYDRATVQQTYDQIIADLKSAAELLPVTSSFATRPNKVAAYGALARAYLSMHDYTNAAISADAALSLRSTLIDYNTLTPAGNPLLPDLFTNNVEVIFNSLGGTDLVQQPRAIVDTTLYASYDNNDLRKTIFFGSYGNNRYYFKGSYYSSTTYNTFFYGIATDELYLIRAECKARAGNASGAMNDLNYLLRRRWKNGTFADIVATNPADALARVLTERRKELLFRGLRWTDLRRFNLEGANITLKRIVNGTTYTLPPNDPRWVLFIPELEISRSGIAQNIR